MEPVANHIIDHHAFGKKRRMKLAPINKSIAPNRVSFKTLIETVSTPRSESEVQLVELKRKGIREQDEKDNEGMNNNSENEFSTCFSRENDREIEREADGTIVNSVSRL